MNTIARTDTSIVGRWWWTVDRWALLSLLVLMVLGAMLTQAASPAVAERIGYEATHFSLRHFVFLPIAVGLLFLLSLLSTRGVRRLAVIGFAVSVLLALATLLVGPEIKGATRWLSIGGLSMQPTEFMKPFFAVVTAWMLAAGITGNNVPGRAIALLLLSLVLAVLVLQPDIGMAVVVTAIWGAQLFVAGLPMLWVAGCCIAGLLGLTAAYFTIPHVTGRIDRFLDPSSGDSYQIDRALEAFSLGGFFGRGPGEGMVKQVLPDAHTDFIFAVAAEEYGLLFCLLLLLLFAFVTLRGLSRLLREDDMFVILAAVGLLAQFGLQAVINIGVNLHLLPTKGMTLPFISYGGSSMLALAIGMGMLLALTRRRPGRGGNP